jgi:DNA-binding CsgD family transcriptional regulator
MSDTPITPTRERVKDLIEKGLTVLEIAHLLRISPQAVYKHLKRYDLPLPSQREAS